MKPLAFVILTAFLISGCAGRGRVDMTKETDRLLQTDRDFAAASLEHGAADAFRMYLAEEATMFSDGRHPVRGRDSIYDLMKPGADGYVLEWTPRAAEVASSGDMGWTWGEYTVTVKGVEGAGEKSYGKYVNVWKKNAEGEWKVVADIGNDSPPPGEPE